MAVAYYSPSFYSHYALFLYKTTKILDLLNVNLFEDNKSNVAAAMAFFSRSKDRKLVGKEENAVSSIFCFTCNVFKGLIP